MITRRTFSGAALGLLAAGSRSFAAAEFPSREITFVVPWNAGGANDIMARGVQPLLKDQGVNIIVENQPGATGTIGMRRVATSTPDGYTLGMGTSSTLAYMAQGRTPLRDEQFTHIARISVDPNLLLLPEASPIKTIAEFLDHMKKNPGSVTIGTPGNYNVNHIFASMTARLAGVEYLNVVYTGGAKVITDLAGRQIQAAVLKPSESIGQITSNLVRPIGVFGNDRLALLPDVPTFKEQGYDIFPFGPIVQMAYVDAPASLPADVRSKLISAFGAAINDKRFKDFGDRNSFLVENLTGDALSAEIDKVAASLKIVSAQLFRQ